MKSFLFLFITLFIIKVNSQQVESVYISKIDKKFANRYKNYTIIDSLILYKDQTFKKRYLYMGFDEVMHDNFKGSWKMDKDLELSITERGDSLTRKISPYTMIYKVRSKYLKSINRNERKLKRVK